MSLGEKMSVFDIEDIKRRMNGAISSLKHDFASIRTGRASSQLLDPIHVDAYGAHTPLAQLATISVPEPRLLSIQVWDRGLVAAVEKAIRNSDLGLNPMSEGQVIRLRLPDMTEQRRLELKKVASKYAENAKIAVRHVRGDARDILKRLEKDNEISEDENKSQADIVQKLTDQAITDIDALLVQKEADIMQV